MGLQALKRLAWRGMQAKRFRLFSTALCFALVGLFLFAAHYVQNYSDPVHYMRRMMRWAQGESIGNRAPVYPMLLYVIEAVVGPDWVFLSNLPFLLLMLGVLAGLTYQLHLHTEPAAQRVDYAWLAALMAVCILFLARRDLLLQLVNPFREPLTFSLALLSLLIFWSGWTQKKLWAAGLAGVLLGVATSIRETSLLMVLPMGLWALTRMREERRVPLGRLAALGAGLLLGMAPLLIKNFDYSGHALIPAYSSRRIETYSQTGYWDIPVPGMSLRYFSRVAPDVLRRLWGRYSPAGAFFLLVGIVQAVKQRRRFILYAILPAAGFYVFFYMFYNRYMARYLLAGELFAVMVMAGGVAASCRLLAERLARFYPRLAALLPRLVCSGMLLWLGVLCVHALVRDDGRTKVWHLPTIRAEIMANIETPAAFMGHWHFARRMQWMMGADPYEYTRRFQRQRRTALTTEKRLAEQGAFTLEAFADGRHYYIDESPFALAANWLERKPVFDFARLSVPFERYGRPLDGNLYTVTPWHLKTLTLSADSADARPHPALLMLDLKRAWDYPHRTYLKGRERADGPLYSLTNAVQFIQLRETPRGGPFEFQVSSDEPLPPDPYWALLGLNDEIRLAYGMAADHWAWNFVSDSLYPGRAIPFDACQLFDQGILRLPTFATPDRRVYAEVRMEFVRDDSYWHGQTHTVDVASQMYAGTWPLPPPRTQSRVFVPLGRGAGTLVMRELRLKTSLPSHEKQNTYPFRARYRRNGFVKIYDTRIHAIEEPNAFPVTVDVGARRDGVHVVRGFHYEERGNGHTSRWTSGCGEIRLLLPEPDRPLLLCWTVLPHRPDLEDVTPVLTVNGRRIDPAAVRIVPGKTAWRYEAKIDPEQIAQGDAYNYFTLETSTWVPAERLRRSQDRRRLGVSVERFEVGYP